MKSKEDGARNKFNGLCRYQLRNGCFSVETLYTDYAPFSLEGVPSAHALTLPAARAWRAGASEGERKMT
jgi:hypothetical protein